MPSPSEVYESRGTKRGGEYSDGGPANMSAGGGSNSSSSGGAVGGAQSPMVQRSLSYERAHQGQPQGSPSSPSETGSLSPQGIKRMSSAASDSQRSSSGNATSPPPLTRRPSAETQGFPLNDIDYESSPAVVAQELSNLQAIRRMSMNVDTADPDLPAFGGVVPNVAPKGTGDGDEEEDAARLFWVPASMHPELAPKEFKTFIEDRVDKIRRRSGDSDSLSADGLERSGSNSSGLRRKKSTLRREIDTRDPSGYEDGAELLERKRSKGMRVQGETTVADLAELETLVNDPQQLMRRMSLDTVRRSQDSGIEVPPTEDMPILPPGGQQLKRSTRTTYRRGSLKKGERVPFSKRVQHRHADSEEHESPVQSPATPGAPQEEPPAPERRSDEREPILGLTRVQTEPTPPPPSSESESQAEGGGYGARTSSRRRPTLGGSQSSDNIVGQAEAIVARQRKESLDESGGRHSPPVTQQAGAGLQQHPPEQHNDRPSFDDSQQYQQQGQREVRRPQPRQFQSRLASGPGRTTAQLPGYNNTNPLPHVIETLSDGSKVPVGQAAQSSDQPQTQPQQQPKYPERKSSHELPRPAQRQGAHGRPVPGAQRAGSTLNDLSSHPSPLPGSGNTRTDALTMVPTFSDERKSEKKEGGRKSSWKWILGNDDDEGKEKKNSGLEPGGKEGAGKSKVGSKLTKASHASNGREGGRLDALQNSIDGGNAAAQAASPRGRESLVLSRSEIQLDEETSTPALSKKKDGSKKSSDSSLKDKKDSGDKEKEPGLLQTLFGS